MSSPTPDRNVVEDLWRQRLMDAKLRLDFARSYMKEVQEDFKSGNVSEDMERFAYTKALRAENFALAEYNRVLHIFSDLTLHGTIPDASEWLNAQAADASDSESE